VNPSDKFALVFKQMVEALFMERMDQNEDIFVRYMNDKAFQKEVTSWMATEAYRKLRDRPESDGDVPAARLPPMLRLVEPEPTERYVTCVPLLPLQAAAGAFSGAQQVDGDDCQWVVLHGRTKAAPGLFVAQVVGESMNRRIPNGAWCVWRANPAGTRQGKVVLAEHRNIDDVELGGRYTVKVYESEKVVSDDSDDGEWRHAIVRLEPDSDDPEFKPILLEGLQEGELRIIAELVEVLA
jgi:hypothetical protein